MYYYDIIAWGSSDPSKKDRALDHTSKLFDNLVNIINDDDALVFSSSELNTMSEILRTAEDRIRRDVIGAENVIREERNKTIDKLTIE